MNLQDRQDVADEPEGRSEAPTARRQVPEASRAVQGDLAAEEVRQRLHESEVRRRELEAENEQLRKTVQQLEKYRDRYIDLYDSAPLGYVTLDEEGYIQEINLTGARLLNADREAMTGYPLVDYVPQEDRQAFLDHLQQCMRGNQEATSELRLVPNGRPPITAQLHSVPIVERETAFCKTAITDITQRKQMERDLRESEEEFRAMFQDASVGRTQVDAETGQFLRVNPKFCEMTGYTCDELLQMNFAEITHPADRERDRAAYHRLVQGEARQYSLEKRYIRKDGSLFWVEVNGGLIRDGNGRPHYTTAVVLDITARKLTEERLRESELRARRT